MIESVELANFVDSAMDDACALDCQLRFAPLYVHIRESFWRAVAEEKAARLHHHHKAFANEPIRFYLPLRTTADSTPLRSNVVYALDSSLRLGEPAPKEPCREVRGRLVQFATLRELDEMNLAHHAGLLAEQLRRDIASGSWGSLLSLAVFCLADIERRTFYYRTIFPALPGGRVVVASKRAVAESLGPLALRELRSYLAASRDAAADVAVFVIAPDPVRPGFIMIKPFSPLTALVQGAVVAFCDSSTSLERPGQVLRNLIAALDFSGCRGGTFLALRDAGVESGCYVAELIWDKVALSETALVTAVEAVGWCDGGKIQCVDLSRVLPPPRRLVFDGALAICGGPLALSQPLSSGEPHLASLAEVLTAGLGWTQVSLLAQEGAQAADSVESQLEPLIDKVKGKLRGVDAVAIWMGDCDIRCGFRIDEIASNITRAASLVRHHGAVPFVIAVPSLTAAAAQKMPHVLRMRRELADLLRRTPDINFVDVFRSSSDVVSGELFDDQGDPAGERFNSHGMAVVADLLARKMAATLPSLFAAE